MGSEYPGEEQRQRELINRLESDPKYRLDSNIETITAALEKKLPLYVFTKGTLLRYKLELLEGRLTIMQGNYVERLTDPSSLKRYVLTEDSWKLLHHAEIKSRHDLVPNPLLVSSGAERVIGWKTPPEPVVHKRYVEREKNPDKIFFEAFEDLLDRGDIVLRADKLGFYFVTKSVTKLWTLAQQTSLEKGVFQRGNFAGRDYFRGPKVKIEIGQALINSGQVDVAGRLRNSDRNLATDWTIVLHSAPAGITILNASGFEKASRGEI